ncbi:MAG: hypothetical protein CVT82_10380 [Alphaproteobacteria bacterium HGW-Alphaproteobacteria-4]|jgi:hypothetical protein|nr:MAG: hypothetical protein CVT82_10380 [Alphaproteobacteria bacterium HGW-Alphaproteobacteria-4]
MLGVVVWCDAAAAGAVIWCDDHAQLAYFKARDGRTGTAISLHAGDLVQFSIREKSGVRFARDLRILAKGVLPRLPEALHAAAAAQLVPVRTAPRLRSVG